MNKIQLFFIYLFFSLFLSSCNAEDDINEWVSKYVSSDEHVLCQVVRGSDFFMIARDEDPINAKKLKIGYKLDVTPRSGGDAPLSFVISVEIKDENGRHVGVNVAPEILEERYVMFNDMVYAEHVSYQHIFVDTTEKIDVTMSLNKYIDSSNVPNASDFDDSVLIDMNVCNR